MSFFERNLGRFVTGASLATSACIGAFLYQTHQIKKYSPNAIETSLDVFRKNTAVYAKTRSRTRDMSPKQEYETWKHVNDSLDWEQAKALSQCVQDYNLQYKIAEELKDANAQQAVNRWKQVVDSLKKVK